MRLFCVFFVFVSVIFVLKSFIHEGREGGHKGHKEEKAAPVPARLNRTSPVSTLNVYTIKPMIGHRLGGGQISGVVGIKFQLYTASFLSLPFYGIDKTGILLSLLARHATTD